MKIFIIPFFLFFFVPAFVNAQEETYFNFFSLGLDTSDTYQSILTKFGTPTIDQVDSLEGGKMTYHYNNDEDDYSHGWVTIWINKAGKLNRFWLKTADLDREAASTLSYFQQKFNLNPQLVSLYSLDEKELLKKVQSTGVTPVKEKTGVTMHKQYGCHSGKNGRWS
ncbi:MAG: hypothetical protein K2X86_10525 [Cytophagaceae bacterium]|nr:hypothetical protein [Cytophagaceae bacterium]